MSKSQEKKNQNINSLRERAKELNCIYRIEEILLQASECADEVLQRCIEVIPSGFQYPDDCNVRLVMGKNVYTNKNFNESNWVLRTELEFKGVISGILEVFYSSQHGSDAHTPFLSEEKRLLNSIGRLIAQFAYDRRAIDVVPKYHLEGESKTILELLSSTDKQRYLRIARKMLNHLYRSDLQEAVEIMKMINAGKMADASALSAGFNRPLQRRTAPDPEKLSAQIFEVAGKHLSDREIVRYLHQWLQQEKSAFLVRALNDAETGLDELGLKLDRFKRMMDSEGLAIPGFVLRDIIVLLIRRLMSGQLRFIRIAKEYFEIGTFHSLLSTMIFPVRSHGKLGGKGSGLVLASEIIRKKAEEHPELKDVRIPKTWFITSDGLHEFIRYNEHDDVFEQKYKEVSQVRQEYPQIIELFKSSAFSPEIQNKLSIALDDLGDVPIIVRSSSLLEDQLGSAFSGKYRSIFLGNQGTKEARLAALTDAIAEVYASTFSPDAIEYRGERDLLDFYEQMGILLQEVVGNRVGDHYLPLYAGVAFSRNEFRWSPRIKREDGLIRIVPGLGTRAVDRLSDDFPILIAPGQPSLRVNVSPEEIIRYSPRKIDVINIASNRFETIDAREFLVNYAHAYPKFFSIYSTLENGRMRSPSFADYDLPDSEPVVSFDGLIKNTDFIKKIRTILNVLEDTLQTPVDIEFASDGKSFYLLQCRPQSHGATTLPDSLPRDIDQSDILFTAKKFVSNGSVPSLTHAVLIDPAEYSKISERDRMLEIGKIVSRLNSILPKRKFTLMGPGRWGSRGDIRLGVNVTYSDINNTALLVEIARKKGNYVPDLSFGTHFFQDLVEANIRYLPLYPDDPGTIFNESVFTFSPNILSVLLPEFKEFEDIVKVIEFPTAFQGKLLKVYLNADLDEAIGVLQLPR